MNLLETKGLSKHYAGLKAVEDVDFVLPEGGVRALIGPNGAGKTTFVSLLSGRIQATAGQVIFKGKTVTSLSAHQRISLGMAYTFQITSIFSRLSVHENVALAARRLTQNRQLINDNVNTALERVGLAQMAKQIAGDLSYGHQRLLEIAMGLVQSPQLFILDEPTQGLAEAEIASFITLIKGLSTETSILLIEHNMDVVMATADTITVLNFGEILAEGTPDEIKSNESVQAAYLGTH